MLEDHLSGCVESSISAFCYELALNFSEASSSLSLLFVKLGLL